MMNKIKSGGLGVMMAGVLAAGLVSGCGTPGPKAWNLSINKTTPASIQVDVIGIKESENPVWEGYNIDKYWSDGDLRRINAQPLTQILKLGQPWVIPANDPKWQKWIARGDTELLIIGNLPGRFDAGPADPRRLIIPLQPVWQTKNNTLEIEVQDTLIQVNTPQKPK